jgi:hypothetical protein
MNRQAHYSQLKCEIKECQSSHIRHEIRRAMCPMMELGLGPVRRRQEQLFLELVHWQQVRPMPAIEKKSNECLPHSNGLILHDHLINHHLEIHGM